MIATNRYPNRNARAALAALAPLAAALAMLLALAPIAWAVTLDAPFSITDDATRVEVAKLDKGNHEFVQGAKLAIVEKSTGTVVDSWVSAKSVHELVGKLEAGTTYILEEVQAPKGYSKAANVEFQILETEVGIKIISGADAKKSGDYRIELYDTAVTGQVVHRASTTTRTAAPRTGDETPLELVAGLVVAAIASIGVLELAKRRLRRES